MEVSAKQGKGNSTRSLVGLFILGSGLVLLGLVVGLLALGVQRNMPANSARFFGMGVLPAKVEFTVPDLSLEGLDGREVSIADYRGKIILINNWATWCPPCQEEMPDLQAYYDKHNGEDFMVIGIEAGETESEVSRFVEANGLTFPVLLDPENLSLSAFRNQGLPSTYVVDREGMVRLAWTGAVSLKVLEEFVTPLIKE